ncbi:MAG: DMT family transporter [Candidatus Kapaibacteriota bacterium]
MLKKNNSQKSYLFAIFAILFWSTVASAFKISLSFINVYQLLAIASFSSLFILLIILAVNQKINLLLKQTKKDWSNSLVLGFINPFLYYIILFNAYNLLPAQEAMILNYSWPIVLTLFTTIFFKNKLSLQVIFALLISFFGIIIIATKGNLTELKFSNLTGILLALGSAFVWSIFWLINMKDKREPLIKLTSSFIFGSLFSFLIFIILPNKINFNFYGILSAIYVGFFEMGVTFVFWLKAISSSKNTAKINNLIYLTPFLSLLFISFILKEKIFLSSLFGLFFILLGIFINYIYNENKK